MDDSVLGDADGRALAIDRDPQSGWPRFGGPRHHTVDLADLAAGSRRACNSSMGPCTIMLSRVCAAPPPPRRCRGRHHAGRRPKYRCRPVADAGVLTSSRCRATCINSADCFPVYRCRGHSFRHAVLIERSSSLRGCPRAPREAPLDRRRTERDRNRSRAAAAVDAELWSSSAPVPCRRRDEERRRQHDYGRDGEHQFAVASDH